MSWWIYETRQTLIGSKIISLEVHFCCLFAYLSGTEDKFASISTWTLLPHVENNEILLELGQQKRQFKGALRIQSPNHSCDKMLPSLPVIP